MFFYFKKSKIVVDCFTAFKSVHDVYPIKPAIHFYPEEMSRMSSYYEEESKELKSIFKRSTIRRCVGINDLYKSGFIIPLWTDVAINTKSGLAGGTTFALMNKPFSFEVHPPVQYPNMFEEYWHIKLESVWHLREKSGVSFTWNPAIWNLHKLNKNVLIPPGVLHFDVQGSTNLNMFLPKNAGEFSINAGTPMVHLVPQSEKDLVIKTHLVSMEEIDKIGIPVELSSIFPNRYLRYRKALSKNKKSKCPFGFK